jgi:two-component system chemotaxis response regulator CheB
VAHRDLVVIGASAGGIEALQQLLSRLPGDLNAAVLVVIHTSNHSGGLLPRVLQRGAKLPVTHPVDGTLIERGRVYVAPPNFHMIVEGDALRVIQGPRENLHRPAIDPLFRSAAASYGRRVIGVILTGALDDGTAGLMVVHAHGGEAIVQDPDSALFSSMPQSALQQVPTAQVLSLPDIADRLVQLVQGKLANEAQKDRPDIRTAREIRIAELDMSELDRDEHPGQPSPFACPDCGGVLWETEGDVFLRFRCRVGHAFTARHLDAEQRHAIEAALWAALRALEESASLYRRMAERAEGARHRETAEIYSDRALNTTENVRTLRDFLLQVNKAEGERLALEEV